MPPAARIGGQRRRQGLRRQIRAGADKSSAGLATVHKFLIGIGAAPAPAHQYHRRQAEGEELKSLNSPILKL